MIYYNSDKDPINKANIQIKSDAYVSGIPTFIRQNPSTYVTKLSIIHRLLYTTRHKPNAYDITIGPISEKYLNELVLLHKEWLPTQYSKDYFKKFIYKQRYFALGAYITINGADYLVGCLLGNIQSEKKLRDQIPDLLPKKSFLEYFSQENTVGYVCTLGVIDEYRKMGVGKKLVDTFIEQMRERECIAVYLHCVDYNKGGNKFYERIGWNLGNVKKKFYLIDGNYYDANVFYYILVDNIGFKNANIDKSEENIDTNDLHRVDFNRRGCCQSLIKAIREVFGGKQQEVKGIYGDL